jgi:hypothetical protein
MQVGMAKTKHSIHQSLIVHSRRSVTATAGLNHRTETAFAGLSYPRLAARSTTVSAVVRQLDQFDSALQPDPGTRNQLDYKGLGDATPAFSMLAAGSS